MTTSFVSYNAVMLSVIFATRDNEGTLPRALTCLVPAAVSGLVKDVVIADGGSCDRTSDIAEDTGAQFLQVAPDRGAQLDAGAEKARGEWLLFLEPTCFLEPGWALEVEAFIARAELSPGAHLRAAAVFRYAVDDVGPAARRREWWVRLRNILFALPYGNQGLLIHRQLFAKLGGYHPGDALADVGIVRKLGRRRLLFLRTAAISMVSAEPESGPLPSLRGLMAAVLHALRVPTHVIARICL